jgi:hypothetical protein
MEGTGRVRNDRGGGRMEGTGRVRNDRGGDTELLRGGILALHDGTESSNEDFSLSNRNPVEIRTEDL